MKQKNQDLLTDVSLGSYRKIQNLSVIPKRKDFRSDSPYLNSGSTSSKIVRNKPLQNENRLRRISFRHRFYRESLNVILPGVEYIEDTLDSEVEPLNELEIQHLENNSSKIEVFKTEFKLSDKANQAVKSNQVERSQKADKVESSQKSDKVERSHKSDKVERSQKSDKLEKIQKLDKLEKAVKVEKSQKAEKPPKLDLCHIKILTFNRETPFDEPKTERYRTPIKLQCETPEFNTDRNHHRARSRNDDDKVHNDFIQKFNKFCSRSGSRDSSSPIKEKTHNKVFQAWTSVRNKIMLDPRVSNRKLNEASLANEAYDNTENAAHHRITKLHKQGMITSTSSYNGLIKLQTASPCPIQCSKSLKTYVQHLVKNDSKLKTVKNQMPSYLQPKQLHMTNSVNRLRKRSSEICS